MSDLKFLAYSFLMKSVYVVCVTLAAMHFNNHKILWWYVLGLLVGYSYETKKEASQ